MKHLFRAVVCVAIVLLGAQYAAPDSQERPSMPDSTTMVTEVKWSGQAYVVKRDTVELTSISDFFAQHFHAIYERVSADGGQIVGPPSGLYWSWDEQLQRAYMGAAIPVAGDVKAPEGYELITLPDSKALHVDYYGAYEGTGAAHEAIDNYIHEHDKGMPRVAVEQYITDPQTEPDTTKWHTAVFYVYDGAE